MAPVVLVAIACHHGELGTDATLENARTSEYGPDCGKIHIHFV
jgi:hypothetical protein